MKRRVLLSILYLFALVIGLGATWFALKRVGLEGVTAGAWRSDLLAGSEDAGPYTRARIAVNAVLALDRSETIYFLATHDDQGKPLRAECHYRLAGVAPNAAWWSITAYAADNFLFPVESHRYSISGDSLNVTTGETFEAKIGPKANNADIAPDIETAGSGELRLTLRLYKPDAALQKNPASLQAPSIELVEACL